MHDIYALKEMLCDELEEYGKKGELDMGGLEIVDKLAHTVKNLGKIIEMYEESEDEGSFAMDSRYYDGGGVSYRDGNRGNRGGGSYARGRGGRGGRRDSMGRYSRAEDMISQLRSMEASAPDEATRSEIRKLIMKMEQTM